MQPTSEQGEIIDAARQGSSLVVQAGAGTGKTTTLKQVSEHVRKQTIYIAYNRVTADEARRKFPRHVDSRTMHSLAFRAVGKDYAARLNGPRQTVRDAADVLGIGAIDLPLRALLRHGRIIDRLRGARLVAEAVNRFCISADEQITVHHVPPEPLLSKSEYNHLAELIVPYAERAWKDICNVEGRLRFTHDHYLKIWALQHPRLPADVVMLDEAQDTNPVVAQIVREQTNAQQVVVGDSDQQLYQWRGAVDALATWPADRELLLTQSWRFGPQIADEANKWLSVLNSHKRLTGVAAHPSRLVSLKRPGAVLCRTNSGTVRHAITELSEGRKVAIVGGGAEVRRLADAADQLNGTGSTNHPELYLFSSWQQVREFADEPAGADMRTFVDLVDKYGTSEIVRVVDSLTSEERADVVISTAHKAKGREWTNVQISDDFNRATTDKDGAPTELKPIWPPEAMLAYVAVTRAREELDVGGLAWIDQHIRPTPEALAPVAKPQPTRPDFVFPNPGATAEGSEDQWNDAEKVDGGPKWSSNPTRTAGRIAQYDEYMARNVLGDSEIICRSFFQCHAAAMGPEGDERTDRDYYPAQMGYVGTHYDMQVDGVHRRILIVGMERGEGPSFHNREARSRDHDRAKVPSNRNPHMRGVMNALKCAMEIPDTDWNDEYLGIQNAGPTHVLDAYALINLRLCSAVKRTARGRESAQIEEMSKNCETHLAATVRILQPTLTIIQGKRLWPNVQSALNFEKRIRADLPLYLGRVDNTRRLVAAFNHPSASDPHGWSNPRSEYFRTTVAPTIDLANAIVGRASARQAASMSDRV
ncbi:UvrD-helicase domain-containing protein [Gordonia sp. L191]|uniref:UvrD-helicase domain-containing protein n=1 Tax=Gordonia sp. L191 TaxID=2982699 RepID=UPI0024C00982|nr:UvrD-helicase domain-containing protein [Gordonia sp. L191]WHU46922.1 UvrD-helicase domain-containing protein [Gordonia sp. L191]